MRRFLTFLLILMFVISPKIVATDAFSFEDAEYKHIPDPDNIPTGILAMKPFTTGYRDSDTSDFRRVEGGKWVEGSHCMAINMTHRGRRWLVFAKNAREQDPPQSDALDSTFLHGVGFRDTLYYWLFVPWNAHIDSIFIFVRDAANWKWDELTVYHPSDLNYGKWNELKDGVSEMNTEGDPFTIPLIQSDFEIHTDPSIDPPACTLYLDAISSKGRVPPEFIETTGQTDPQGGIKIPEPGDNPVKVAKTSINCIEYALGVSAPVMIQVFDLTGRKKKEMPIGFQAAGVYSIPLNLTPGVYFTRVTTDKNEGIGKIICVK